jgi:predicted RND superfamily exporter protein
MISIVVTTVWAVGAMEMTGIPITLVSMILPPLMLALGSSYSIHMMSEYLSEVQPELSVKEIVKESLDKITVPVVVCSFTTMIGFGSLVLNKIPAIQDLGKAAILGIFFAMLVALFVSPAALMIIKKPKKIIIPGGSSKMIEDVLDKVGLITIKNRHTIFAVAVVMGIICIYGATKVKIDTDFLSFFKKDDPVMLAVEAQTKHLSGAAPFNIVLEANRPDVFKHPAMLKRIEELQRWAEEEVEGIDSTVSMADFVKMLSQAFHGNDPAYYIVPDSPVELSQMLFLFSSSSNPNMFAPYITSDYMVANILIRSRLVGSTETNEAIAKIEAKAKELFKQPVRVIKKPDKAVLQAPLPFQKDEESISWDFKDNPKEKNVEQINWEDEDEFEVKWDDEDAEEGGSHDLKELIGKPKDLVREEPVNDPYAHLPAPSQEEFPWPNVDVHVTGTIYLMNKSADAVSKGQVTGLFTALLAIFIMMSLLFMSPKIGFLAMLPNFFPIVILFGVMGYFGVTLNFSTSLIAAIALGIGVDDTIQYINRYNIEIQKTRDQTKAMLSSLKIMGKPMIYTSLALFSGFIILAFSDFVPIKQFGILTASIMVVALMSNLFILPALLITVHIITLWDLIDLEIGGSPSKYIKIFNGLTDHQAKLAVLNCQTMTFNDGEYIIREGDSGEEMFVLLKGMVVITKGEGEDEVPLFEIQAGDGFGEMALLRHAKRSASAMAVGDVKLFVLDEQILQRLQKRYPKISNYIYYNLSRILSDRLQNTTTKIYESARENQ